MNEDRIAKQKLSIILIVDASKSMQGSRIAQVDQAVLDIKDYLKDLEAESSNVDFYITIIPFNNDAYFYNQQTSTLVDNFVYNGIKCGGWTNLHFAYARLGEILKKESQGGIMPDFGGVAPIILLLTDGHPTGDDYKEELNKIRHLPWFKVALRYGIAIDLDDKRTSEVLNDFVNGNGDVIKCIDVNVLQKIIKIIILTASKVKSTTSNITYQNSKNQTMVAQQEIAEALSDYENWEW